MKLKAFWITSLIFIVFGIILLLGGPPAVIASIFIALAFVLVYGLVYSFLDLRL